ncbi:MAG: PIN domain-containing protein [Bacillota bacterium]|nr:PIN domain-containing protein [Bacillota bacterium]
MIDNLEFVDTNIFVYAYDTSENIKRRKAKEIIIRLWESGNGCISLQVMQELYVTLTSKLPVPLSREDAISIVADLEMWKHHVPCAADILHSAKVQDKYGLSFWDTLIITSASKMGCSTLWTEDLNSGQTYEGVKAINPFE